jgi:hypothetical protein
MISRCRCGYYATYCISYSYANQFALPPGTEMLTIRAYHVYYSTPTPILLAVTLAVGY